MKDKSSSCFKNNSKEIVMDQRIMEYKMKHRELMNAGGDINDFVALERYYSDVVAFLKRENFDRQSNGGTCKHK